MDIRDWMDAMEVKQLRDWIQSQLAPTRLESIGQKAIEVLKVSLLTGSGFTVEQIKSRCLMYN